MDIGEIIKEIWELPHWWDVLVVAVVDDALLFARLFTGFFSWWPVWLTIVAIIAVLMWIHKN